MSDLSKAIAATEQKLKARKERIDTLLPKHMRGEAERVIERAMFLPLREGAKPMTGKHRCPD